MMIVAKCSRLLVFMALCWTYLLSQTSSHLLGRRVILIAGNFTLDGEKLNVAQYDLQSKTWSKDYQSQLFQYGEDNAVIWDVALNRSCSSNTVYDKLYSVGLFDTVSPTSQIQLCSVARSDGLTFEKVGEGLCARGDISEIVIQTIVLGSNGDLFVGGAFDTRVWDGHHFVYVFNVARFNAKTASWLPLDNGGELKCSNGETSRVNALAWDAEDGVLFMGGNFDTIDNQRISSGIAIWTQQDGVLDFPGGSVSGVMSEHLGGSSEVKDLIYDPQTRSLYVSGTFREVNGSVCPGIAVWSKDCRAWTCLHDLAYSFESITSIVYDHETSYFYVAGLINAASSWNFSASSDFVVHGSATHHGHQYGISRVQMKGYNHHCHGSNGNNGGRRATLSHSLHHTAASSLRHRKLGTVLAGAKKANNNSSLPNSNSSSQSSSWTLACEWLPGFPAFPSPIQRMSPGVKELKGSLFIAAYTDMTDEVSPVSSLLLWTPPVSASPSDSFYNLTVLGGSEHAIRGLVNSVLVDIFLPYSPTDSRKDLDDDASHHNKYPDNPVEPPHDLNRDTDYTFLILFACVGLGILLGLSFTVSCFYRVPEDPSTASSVNYPGKEESGQQSGGISLRTLSDGYGNAMDFKECFERAMKTRHLSTYETLIMINPKEIMLNRIIGEGSFGRVWSGQWRHNKVAVKEFIFAQAAIAGGMTLQRNNIIEEIVGEAGVMACLRHPKILQLYGCSLTMQAIWIVSELCVKGSLKMLLMAGGSGVTLSSGVNHGSGSMKVVKLEDSTSNLGEIGSPPQGIDLSVLQKLAILMDIADGMQYLHQRNPPIIHRDLKSHNIFITETTPGNYIAKIGDWGSARAIALTNSKSMTQGVGTACWLSPEVINNAHFSKASDVYAFGIILWEVHTRQEIYEGLSAAQIIAKVAHEELRPSVPRNCPWAKLMTQCWKQDPSQRPNFDTILKVLSSLHQKYTARIHHSRQQHLFQQQTDQATAKIPQPTPGHPHHHHHHSGEYIQSPNIDIAGESSSHSYHTNKSSSGSPYNTGGTSAGSHTTTTNNNKNSSGGLVKRSSLRSAPSVMELSYLVSTSYTSNTPIHSNLVSLDAMDNSSKNSKTSSTNSPLVRPPQSSTAATFTTTINSNRADSPSTATAAVASHASPIRLPSRNGNSAGPSSSANTSATRNRYGFPASTQTPSLLTAFDSFHPSLENIQFDDSPMVNNKEEPSTHHLAPEIVTAQFQQLSAAAVEPPDPLDFLFQDNISLSGSTSTKYKPNK